MSVFLVIMTIFLIKLGMTYWNQGYVEMNQWEK